MISQEIINQCRNLTTEVLKAKCLERDNNSCVRCGFKQNVEVHHLRYRIPPRLSDLKSLCRSCHKHFHSKEKASPQKIFCLNCDSSQVYFRRLTSERVCKLCGHVEKMEVKNETTTA